MVADSISDSCLWPSNSRDLAKKKRANWSTKLKQWKLDARPKQWVSLLVAKKGQAVKEDKGGRPKSLGKNQTKTEVDFPFRYIETGWNEEEIDDTSTHNESDVESLAASSPTSVLTSKDSGSKSCDAFCCSGQIEEEEEEVFDDAFDNWEGFSDALSCFEKEDCCLDSSKNESERPLLESKNSVQESSKNPRNTIQRDSSAEKALYKGQNPLPETEKAKEGCSETCPNMTQPNSPPEPGPCPICFEEMDATDLSFLPCSCGFKLCLFCHKRIIESDGHCPSCRKVYDTGSVDAEVSFQQRAGGMLQLSPSFRGLDRA